ncbi:MAG: hypothetical protein L0H96_06435 [Humibacillus sp.]|nr:hypothetical protein [Humibacillus sp.]MDN5776530.1 hypothetical protein [Humibacillus sp.]
MPVVRVYLPVGPADLAELAESGSLSATPASLRVAYAVTPELERSAPGADVEDLEYAAFSHAVVAAGAAARGAADRRVVIAADADPDWVVEGEPRPRDSVCAVTLAAAVPRARVASFHIDERGASEEGAMADADALLWYDATELDAVRGFFA